ncbi:hypothetical protein HMPREF0044_0834 [Gleimia coleocanis DSM 15436]|uniref:Metallopeptidase family protein n=1 Tax=Gleimia coleocanis DSM 15436 TaxID=525245 RepID=C0VZV6_9ACTO|nr:metallopeptidase family protein [Gleimia coleocanis]EEH63815.1 hypothetical protein HMPREF0044_0834 [Gleimia coleocanis DSM 15436]
MRAISRRRNRHGRSQRSPLFLPGVPARASWKDSFEQIVAWNFQEIAQRYPEVTQIEVAFEDAPPSDPAPWEDHSVSLARHFSASKTVGLKARIVLYRLPIHARAGRSTFREIGAPLHAMVRSLLIQHLSELTGISEADLHGKQF